MSVSAVAAVAVAFLADRAVGEFPERIHPVALFGRVVGLLDRPYSRPRPVGAATALVLPLSAGVIVGGLVVAASSVRLPDALPPDALAVLVAGTALFATTSLRMLLGVAREVLALAEEDLSTARERLRALAGRDASDLSPGQVRSAVVESVAENLADGLVGPLLAFALGALISLPLAAGAAAWLKAVNTLDSMLGYPAKPHGTASARLDDAVMLVPARLSAVLLAFVAPNPGALRRAGTLAQTPASPNSGWPMATLAAALDVRLEKPGAYVLGTGELPTPERAARGVRLVGRAGLLAWALAGGVAWY